jgi:hypothetical protein
VRVEFCCSDLSKIERNERMPNGCCAGRRLQTLFLR